MKQNRNSQNAQNPETKVEKMFEHGYCKSNYGPDELVTDAHGNPISVVDAMPRLKRPPPPKPGNTASVLPPPRIPAHRLGHPPVRGDRHHPAFGGAVGFQPARYTVAPSRPRLPRHAAHGAAPGNFDNLVEHAHPRIIAFTAHATKLYTEVEYADRHPAVLAPEPGDIPDPMDIMEGPHAAEQVTAHACPAFPRTSPIARPSPSMKPGANSIPRWRALRRRPGGPSSSDAERMLTGVREELLSLAARPSSQKMGLSALEGLIWHCRRPIAASEGC